MRWRRGCASGVTPKQVQEPRPTNDDLGNPSGYPHAAAVSLAAAAAFSPRFLKSLGHCRPERVPVTKRGPVEKLCVAHVPCVIIASCDAAEHDGRTWGLQCHRKDPDRTK